MGKSCKNIRKTSLIHPQSILWSFRKWMTSNKILQYSRESESTHKGNASSITSVSLSTLTLQYATPLYFLIILVEKKKCRHYLYELSVHLVRCFRKCKKNNFDRKSHLIFSRRLVEMWSYMYVSPLISIWIMSVKYHVLLSWNCYL